MNGNPSAYRIRDLQWQVSPEFRLNIPALELPAGKTTALLGRSASGKSTLLSLLGRVEGNYFERPDALSGHIDFAVDGQTLDLLALSERDLLKRRLRGPGIGFVFQREGLFPGRDAIDNVAWPLRALGRKQASANEIANAALSKVGLAPDRQVATLSGGERKRLAIARAIALSPQVLLLDEPLTGLDPEALGGLRELLVGLSSEGRTMVIVTHQREDVLALAHHLVFMDRGQVALHGSREALGRELDGFFSGDVPRVSSTIAGAST